MTSDFSIPLNWYQTFFTDPVIRFTVAGFDLSDAALGRAQALARTEALPVRFARSEMLEFAPDAPGDALICMGNSIGYFEPALTQKLSRKLASVLRSGGRLIIDTSICAESLLPISPGGTFSFSGGSYEREISYDPMRFVIKTRALLTIEGRKHELLYHHFVMTSGELVRSMRCAGFDVSALYGDTQDAAFGPGSPRLLLVAVKK